VRRFVMFAENKANITSNVLREETSTIVRNIVRGEGISLLKNY